MKWILLTAFALSGCASKPVKQIYEELQAAPESQLLSYNQIDFAKTAKLLKFEDRNSVTLDPSDPIVRGPKGEKSHFKIFRLPEPSVVRYFEVFSMPYRPVGFGGEFRIFDPALVFFDRNGKALTPQPTEIMKVMSTTFVYGKNLRTVWALPEKPRAAYVMLTAKAEKTGENAMSVTQYGVASVGVIYDEQVIFAPTGWAHLLPTAVLKK